MYMYNVRVHSTYIHVCIVCTCTYMYNVFTCTRTIVHVASPDFYGYKKINNLTK